MNIIYMYYNLSTLFFHFQAHNQGRTLVRPFVGMVQTQDSSSNGCNVLFMTVWYIIIAMYSISGIKKDIQSNVHACKCT